jgi:proteic killer suppression protein
MIQSWRTKAAKEVFEGRTPKGFPADLAPAVRRRLFQLHAAAQVEDMRSPPGNRLHKLTDDRLGQWSVSVNDQFRICFEWGENGPENVEFTDYH